MLASTWAQEAPGLLRLLPRLEPLRPLDARELAGLRIPGDEARDEEARGEVELPAGARRRRSRFAWRHASARAT